jgi:translocation and assembly module TamB
MKPLRMVLWILIALALLVPTAGLYVVASTQAGLRFIAARVGQLGAVTVTMEQVSGTLVDGFTIGSLRVQQRRADVRITNASGQLRLLPLLLQRRIELSSAEVAAVTVQVVRVTGGGRAPRALRFLPETFGVAVDSLRAGSVELVLASGRTLHATNLSAAAEVLPRVIRIRDAQLDWNDMHLAADGRVHATKPMGLDGRLAIDWRPQGKPAWRFDTRFDGDLNRLPLELDIGKPFHARIKGTASTLTTGWKLAGNGATEDLDISVFGAGKALGILSAQVALTIDANGFSARGPVTAPGLKAGPLQVDFRGAYARRRLTIRDSTLLHQASGSRATVQGTVDVVPQGPQLALAGSWTTLQWPLVAEKPAFTSTQGQYTIEGLKPWQVSAAGTVTAAGLTDMPANLRGALGTESFAIEQATLGLLGGSANVTGEARWRPEESWNIAGHMSGLDPALLRKDLPGRLDFDLRAAGAPFGEAGGIEFAVARLDGKLRGQNATGSGRFTRPGGSTDWRFHQVDLRLGRARIQLDGSLNAPRDIQFALDADDLSLIDQDARGRVSARGRYAGTDARPLLLFKARGTDFEWQDYRVDAFDADLDIDLLNEDQAQGKVDLTGIHYGARTVQQALLGLSGTGKSQRISLDFDAAPLRAALIADGAMASGQWRGNVQGLTVNDDGDLELRLEKPTPVALDLERLELGDLCLTGDQARGCISGQREPDGWNAAFSILEMPLRAFTAGLSQDVSYEGTINLRGTVAGAAGGLPTGTAHGELMQAQLLHTLGDKRVETIPLGSGTFQAAATTTGFSAEVALDAGASGAIAGKLTGERTDGEWQSYPIRGKLDARTDAVSLLDIYVADIDKATGKLSASIDISGTLGSPELAGQLQLRDATIDIYQSNTALRDLTVNAQFNTRELSLTGESRLGDGKPRSGDGVARFSGKLSWRDGQPYGNLKVEGDGLRVVNLPETRIDASPRLDFQLDGRRLKATGEVRIPWARITSADLTGVLLPSSDEHLVGAPQVDPEQRWIVTSEIRLVLEDDVHINSLGLEAYLGGNITIRTDGSPIAHGQGELNIRSGKFRQAGRQLDISIGKLRFNDGPVDNPNLELRAQRELPDVTVGINVRGPLKGPRRVTLFSEPAGLASSQITSLLVGGGTLESVQDRERPGGARNDILMQATAIAGQNLGPRVGIDDVGVESDINNDTSLVLGKQLSTRLYISYGISLAEAINTFKARLTLGKGWTLKTESGKARSADIVYTFKKGKKAEDKAEDKK